MDVAVAPQHPFVSYVAPVFVDQTASPVYAMRNKHNSHPGFGSLVLLVSEAVLEVVFVSALGFIAAKRGLFSAETQKIMANLNIYFFTPCLIFSKLAQQLNGDKLVELAIIPVILVFQSLVSWIAAQVMTRIFGIRKKPQKNFVIAMAVFGNSNSLPLSLVVSLSHTISGLHWGKIPGDNDDEVGARGILYLLIFSQLGQALRWSWGMNSLLKPLKYYTKAELGEDDETGSRYKDDPTASRADSIISSSTAGEDNYENNRIVTDETAGTSSAEPHANGDARQRTLVKQPNGDVHVGDVLVDTDNLPEEQSDEQPQTGLKAWRTSAKMKAIFVYHKARATLYKMTVPPAQKTFRALPAVVQKGLARCWNFSKTVVVRIYDCINVPLAAIIVSILVATIPPVKAIFYTPGSFVNNTFTSAINQLGGVAIPLILFILGGNLCRSVQPKDDPSDITFKKEKKRMLICSLLSRMLIPFLIMAPCLALMAKYLPISILDDPIFLIVCFLLTGAPSALQLAQMCQVNDVYVPVIANLLVHSYVIWIFPSTLMLVLVALEVVEWATPPSSTAIIAAAAAASRIL